LEGLVDKPLTSTLGGLIIVNRPGLEPGTQLTHSGFNLAPWVV